MKKLKFLGVLLVLFFMSNVAVGQTSLPITTYVEDTPALAKYLPGSSVSVMVEWIGVQGLISRTITTTVGTLSAGVNVTSPIFISSPFSLPIVQTNIYIEFSGEIHYTKYRLFAPYAIRSIDPVPWEIEEK